MDNNYWQKQTDRPLFLEIDMQKPERKQLAGRLLIIGGSAGSFFAAASAMSKAVEIGIGEVKVLLPDSLKKQVPVGPDVVFAPSEAAGGFGKGAVELAIAAADEADFVLLIGDMGKNAETVTFAERLMAGSNKPTLITRDAVDLLAVSATDWLGRENMTLCATLPQLQKIFKAVYYPKIITLSMPTNQLIETLHKFTITYPVSVMTCHNSQVVTAQGGKVVSTDLKDTHYNPINIWSGELAVKVAALRIWHERKDFEASVTAVLM